MLGLEEGLAAGEAETGTQVMLICDMDRAFGGRAGLDLVTRPVDLRRRGMAERVIGVGMDSTELGIDPAVTQLLVDRGIPVTVCPGSNVTIGNLVERLEDHPWPRMAAAGLHLTLNSDDPAFMQSDLGAEYAELARAFDYSFDEMVAIALAGVDATWLTASEQAALRSRIAAAAIELANSTL